MPTVQRGLRVALLVFLVCVPVVTQKQDRPEEIAGTYRGSWASDKYDVSGTIVMVVSVADGQTRIRAIFTGSEYFNEDELIAALTPLGNGIWKMSFKGKKSKITGTGIFDNGAFNGDYKFKKLFWTDRGKWQLER